MKARFVTAARCAGFAFVAAGMGCLAAFHMTETGIDENGMLHEQFYLLPAGVLLMGLGLGVWLTGWLAKSAVSCQDPAISNDAEE